jgi:hypothetical protein
MPSQDGCQSTMDGAVVGFNGALIAALLSGAPVLKFVPADTFVCTCVIRQPRISEFALQTMDAARQPCSIPSNHLASGMLSTVIRL